MTRKIAKGYRLTKDRRLVPCYNHLNLSQRLSDPPGKMKTPPAAFPGGAAIFPTLFRQVLSNLSGSSSYYSPRSHSRRRSPVCHTGHEFSQDGYTRGPARRAAVCGVELPHQTEPANPDRGPLSNDLEIALEAHVAAEAKKQQDKRR